MPLVNFTGNQFVFTLECVGEASFDGTIMARDGYKIEKSVGSPKTVYTFTKDSGTTPGGEDDPGTGGGSGFSIFDFIWGHHMFENAKELNILTIIFQFIETIFSYIQSVMG